MLAAYTHMHDMSAGWWVLMTLGWLALVALAVWAVVSLLRGTGARPAQPNAREVLDRRLAEGEISIEEFERLRDALRRPAGSTPSHP